MSKPSRQYRPNPHLSRFVFPPSFPPSLPPSQRTSSQ